MRSAVFICVLLASTAPANAQTVVANHHSASAERGLGLCTVHAGGMGRYVTPIFQWPSTDMRAVEKEFYEHILRVKLPNNGLVIGCVQYNEEQAARKDFGRYTEGYPRFTLLDFVPSASPAATGKKANQKAVGQAGGPAPSASNDEGKAVGPTPAEIAAEKSRAVQERNRQAQAKYEAELAAQKAKVEEFERAKAEVERKKQEQRAAADRALAEHNAKLAAHAQTLRQHEAALAQHKAEVEGSKEEILADFDKRQAAGEASTDTNANRCVSGAEIRYNSGFKGNTAATVSNGCDTKADIQICLKVDARWNCGLRLGVLPRNSYTHAAPGGTGEVQVDARVTGSSRPLVTPS